VLRADRIVDEVQTAGDTRMICELFGIGVQAASRYTRPYADAAAAAAQQNPSPP
jgi:hypothetical protein